MDPHLTHLIDRRLAGDASAAERAELDQALTDNPDLKRLVTSLEAARKDAPPVDTGAAWRRVAARLPLVAPAPVPPSAPRSRWGVGLAVAASLLVLVGAGAAAARWLLRGAPEGSVAREAGTLRGERAVVRLPDGTVVRLAAESRLRYPATFGDSREVSLTGEAFFEVAPDSAHAFVVRAAHAVARVLGTAFTVRAYPGDSTVTIAVTHGRVSLGDTASPGTPVDAGQVGRIGMDGVTVVSREDLDPLVGWTEGRLVFRDAPVPDVLARLSRWSGVAFVAEGDLTQRRLTARFGDDSPDATAAALALALDATTTRHADTVFLRPRGVR